MDTKQQRELCFTLAPASLSHDDGDANHEREADSHIDMAAAADSCTRSAKRQRVASDEAMTAAAVEPHVARVRMVERIRELQDTTSLDDTTHYGLFIWPSAMVLAHFVARHWATVVRGKVVMEIGCGTGLPGILAAVGGEPKAVLLTDRSDAVDIQRNVNANIELNNIGDTTRFVALDWGHVAVDAAQLAVFETVDVLLAADCFYESQHFEDVLATVAFIFRCSPRCKLYTTYQLRSVARTIAPLLARWGMRATPLDTAEFLPTNRDECDGGVSERDVARSSFQSVYLYEIVSVASTPM